MEIFKAERVDRPKGDNGAVVEDIFNPHHEPWGVDLPKGIIACNHETPSPKGFVALKSRLRRKLDYGRFGSSRSLAHGYLQQLT